MNVCTCTKSDGEKSQYHSSGTFMFDQVNSNHSFEKNVHSFTEKPLIYCMIQRMFSVHQLSAYLLKYLYIFIQYNGIAVIVIVFYSYPFFSM